MSCFEVGVIVAILAAVSALPTDHVISKRDPGPRYQYMTGPDGPELVDMWMKTSDVFAAARYSPDDNNGYHLFTRANPTTSQPLPLGYDSILRASHFDARKKTVFLIHGWRNTPLSDFNVHLVHAYLIAEDVNLIMVDWSIGADTSYMIALNNSIRSAGHVAQFITWLNSASGARLDNYHVIGHSLGAHQAGIVGRHLGGALAYISALDPALPGWITNPSSFRATDGMYTEVIHTDAGYSGLVTAVGDVDFYPNGGSNMPGCSDNNCGHHRNPSSNWRWNATLVLNCLTMVQSEEPIDVNSFYEAIMQPKDLVERVREEEISPAAAAEGEALGVVGRRPGCIFYMAESLTQGGFTGSRCDSLTAALSGNCSSSDKLKMGGPTAKPGSSGLYFVATNAYSPFSQG